MKYTLFLFMLGTLYSCNQQEEYYPTLEFITGADEFCTEATDLNSCQALADRCQPAFEDREDEFGAPVFSSCIANPEEWSDTDDPEVTPEEETNPPTIPETIDSKCQISGKYLLTEVVTKKDKVIKKNVKVKLCHNTNNNPHTIIISCNALKAHLSHQSSGDYIGACHQ